MAKNEAILAAKENEKISITKLDLDRNVVKSNKLIEASYKLNLTELKIMYAAISSISMNDTSFKHIIFRASELAEYCGIVSTNKYTELKSTFQKLLGRVVTFVEDDGTIVQTHWIQSARYSPGGLITLKLDGDLMPHLLELKESFTSLKSRELTSFRSTYSARIYELVSQFKSIGKRVIAVDDLRRMFQLSGSYKLIGNIKKRIIEPALEEINTITIHDVTCEYQTNGKGKRITHLLFTIKLKDVQAMEKLAKKNKLEVIDSPIGNAEPPESENVLEYMLTRVGLHNKFDYYNNHPDYSLERIISNIEFTLFKRNTITTSLAEYAKEAIACDLAQSDNVSLFEEKEIQNPRLKAKLNKQVQPKQNKDIEKIKSKLNSLQQQRSLYLDLYSDEKEAERALSSWYREIYKEEYTINTESELIAALP